ncbi:MAG: DUF4062 domain-containing protein, partial [Bacteroidetes bacterium]|nr:DUF4062 domain-containing protein [Bacteroidota bacterium]
CIPAGMELFPAIDDEQFEFIKKIIDDCDYYVLIIGGRYGSISSDGLSYTEKEFDYALEKGIKVLAFIHQNPDNIPLGKSEKTEELRAKLNLFKQRVSTNRLVKYWNSAEELPGLVSLSLSKTIKTYPATGWIRANTIGNPEIYHELNEIRKENSFLKDKLNELKIDELKVENLANLKDKYTFSGHYKRWSGYNGYFEKDWNIELSWEELFSLFSPELLHPPADSSIKTTIGKLLYDQLKDEDNTGTATISDQDFQTIKIHLESIGLINLEYTKTTKGGMGLFWFLTEKGTSLMKELRSVKKQL